MSDLLDFLLLIAVVVADKETALPITTESVTLLELATTEPATTVPATITPATTEPATTYKQPTRKRRRSPSDSPLSDLMDDEGLLSPIMAERQASKSTATNNAAVPTLVQSDLSTPSVESTTEIPVVRFRNGNLRACSLIIGQEGGCSLTCPKTERNRLNGVTPAKKAETSKSSLSTPATADAEEEVKPFRPSRTLKPRQAKVQEEEFDGGGSSHCVG